MSTRFLLRAASGQEYVITGPFRVGRDPECEICINNDLASRIHASIWIDHDHLLLRDERSRNGTLLNGRALAPGDAHYLHHGDEVSVGGTTFVVETDPPYPGPPQYGGLAGQPEAGLEPPPTGRLDKPGPEPAPIPQAAPGATPASATAEAPMPILPAGIAAPPAAAPSPAPPRRPLTWPLVLGGCLVLLLLGVCCAIGFFAVTAGRPTLLTALAPPARRLATPAAPPAAAYAADTVPTLAPQPAPEPVAASHDPAAALGARILARLHCVACPLAH